MKTSTFLKTNFRNSLFLVLALVLLSFSNFKTNSENKSEYSQEVISKNDLAMLPITKNALNHISINDKDTHIWLTVNTELIDEGNLESTVVFTEVDSTGIINSGSPKDFKSIVYKNMKIYWYGVPANDSSNAIIDILDIRRKTNIDDNAKILKFSTKEKKDKGVEIKVKNKNITGEEHYEVQFRIIYEDNSTKTFWVDPKLEMGI